MAPSLQERMAALDVQGMSSAPVPSSATTMPEPKGKLLHSGSVKRNAGTNPQLLALVVTRFAVLHDDPVLLFYEDETRATPKGSFHFSGDHTCRLDGRLCKLDSDGKQQQQQQQQQPPARSLQLQLGTAEEAAAWHTALVAAIASAPRAPPPPPPAPIKQRSSLLDALSFWRASEVEAPVAVGGVELGGETMTEAEREAERRSRADGASEAAAPPVAVVEVFEIPMLRTMLSSVGDAVGATVGSLRRLGSSMTSIGSATAGATKGVLTRMGSSVASFTSSAGGDDLGSLSDEEEAEDELLEHRQLRVEMHVEQAELAREALDEIRAEARAAAARAEEAEAAAAKAAEEGADAAAAQAAREKADAAALVAAEARRVEEEATRADEWAVSKAKAVMRKADL
jgi:hypothetical protein